MFWIHGGGFVYGSAPPYDPTSLVKEDVIVVTINYRLGALGFLNFGNDLAPGNLAIRDQIQSLRWVKMMVWYFGGDPNRITIFGESAGGFSCHAITMSPKAYGLISGNYITHKEKILKIIFLSLTSNSFKESAEFLCLFEKSSMFSLG